MTCYSGLRDHPFDEAELDRLAAHYCYPRVAEVNPRELQTRSGRVLPTRKHKKLSSRIEQHYPRLAVKVLQLRDERQEGSAAAAADLLFALRCLRLFQTKCGADFPDDLRHLEAGPAPGDWDVQSFVDLTAPTSAEVIDIELVIIDCLVVGETKPDPARLAKQAAAQAAVKLENDNNAAVLGAGASLTASGQPLVAAVAGNTLSSAKPTLTNPVVLDLVAPWLSQWGRNSLQATCRKLRKASIESKVVNRTVLVTKKHIFNTSGMMNRPVPAALLTYEHRQRLARAASDEEEKTKKELASFLLWLERRAHIVRHLTFSSSQNALPEQLWELTALQTLELSDCDFEELPPQIGQLTALQMLKLGYCSALKRLPEEISQLTALQTLNLGYCNALKRLPAEIGQLGALQTLNLHDCSALEQLPTEIGQLTALQTLNVRSCSALKELPAAIGQLTALQTLNLRYCCTLKELPAAIGQLTALQRLNLTGYKLGELPPVILKLAALQRLDLNCCSVLKELPPELGQLTALQELDLSGCSALKELPPELGQLTALQELELSGCSALRQLPPELGQLSALQTLNLSGCSALEELPAELGQLTALQDLKLSRCSALEELPAEIGQLSALQTLDLSECSALEELPAEIGQLSALQTLDLSECSALKELPAEIGQLSALQTLDLSKCWALTQLPPVIWQLTALQVLSLKGCSALQLRLHGGRLVLRI